MERRDFLKKSGSLALTSLLTGGVIAETFGKKVQPLGVQLFTLFRTFDQDVKGNLKKIADLGYKEIESAFSLKGGYYGGTAKEFAGIITDLGLKWESHHTSGAPFKPRPGFDTSKMPKMSNLRDNAQEVIDQIAAQNVKYLVCANIPIDSADEVKQAVDILSAAGEKAKKAGLIFCYHNHDKEFQEVEGQKAFDVFANQISPDLMKFELDLGWAAKAKVDFVELFKKHPGRFPLCHAKDFDSEFKKILPVGEGVIDYKGIFAMRKIAGMKHFFIEHDMPEDAFASLKSSITNIRSKKLL